MRDINKLTLSWAVSRGQDTYGYTICRLDDRETGRRYRTCGGGYDMVGTVLAKWLTDVHQDKLQTIKGRSHYISDADNRFAVNPRTDSLYGMHWGVDDSVSIDGACGVDCVLAIARAIGLDMQRDYIARGSRRGETIGWFVSESPSAAGL